MPNTNVLSTVMLTVLLVRVDATSVGGGGGLHSCATRLDNRVLCWGYNNKGQLGNETYDDSSTPVEVSGITAGASVALNQFFSCALLTDGTVKCWGSNENARLGAGTISYAFINSPVDVYGISTASSICVGEHHACAVLKNGEMWCWGKNNIGQLGNGIQAGSGTYYTTATYSPALVQGVTATSCSGGEYHSCAVLTSGGVKCWGWNNKGQLGDGTTTDSVNPVPVEGVDGIEATALTVALGRHFSCALLTDGKVMCWGYNSVGQLGNPGITTTVSPTPVEVLLPTSATATRIAAGAYHACALLQDGKVTCWGNNDVGQLGNPDITTTKSHTPVEVSLPTSATSIATGWSHTCAYLRADAKVMCWGSNNKGQLGDGTINDSRTPVEVVGHFPGPPEPCDASSPPANGAVGNCTDQLLSGTTCQPTCDAGYVAPEPSVCDDGVLTPAVCVRYCNASAPPANGGVGDCVEYMLSDTTCQPTCDEGYIVSGKTSCDAAGTLTAADCRELSCCERTFAKFGFGVEYSYGDEL